MTQSPTSSMHRWPEVDVAAWAETKRVVHLVAQMLGKMRLALSPSQPNWMFTALALTARGVTTGAMPIPDGSLEARLDVFRSELQFETSTGASQTVSLLPARSVSRLFADVQHALDALGVDCTVSPVPQELPDTTPFHEDDRRTEYDPAAVQRWFTAATRSASVFDRWRSHFFGRSGVQLWWGAFDVSVMLFNGKKVEPPRDRGYLMRYDLDAELFNAGFYAGDATTKPFFYGYLFPEPANAATLPTSTGAFWSNEMHEWMLPYDAVRNADDPEAMIVAFLDAIYAAATTSGWDREALSYQAPPSKRA